MRPDDEEDPAVRTVQSAPALPGAHPLFDEGTALAALNAELHGLDDAREIRACTVAWLTAARAEAMADIIAGLATHPRKGRETVRAIAQLTDATVRAVHHVAVTCLHPNLSPTEGERMHSSADRVACPTFSLRSHSM